MLKFKNTQFIGRDISTLKCGDTFVYADTLYLVSSDGMAICLSAPENTSKKPGFATTLNTFRAVKAKIVDVELTVIINEW